MSTESTTSTHAPVEAPLLHLDANGAQLHVGDVVRYGTAQGEVRILEDWPAGLLYPRRAGLYVNGIGYWGDAQAVEARLVELVERAS